MYMIFWCAFDSSEFLFKIALFTLINELSSQAQKRPAAMSPSLNLGMHNNYAYNEFISHSNVDLI